jgi:hypothetical protein
MKEEKALEVENMPVQICRDVKRWVVLIVK